MQLTYGYRIKDKHATRLRAQARAVNFVWNYCNETQMKAARDGRKWLSGYDLWKLVAGSTKEGLDLHSHSAMRVCFQYDSSPVSIISRGCAGDPDARSAGSRSILVA